MQPKKYWVDQTENTKTGLEDNEGFNKLLKKRNRARRKQLSRNTRSNKTKLVEAKHKLQQIH